MRTSRCGPTCAAFHMGLVSRACARQHTSAHVSTRPSCLQPCTAPHRTAPHRTRANKAGGKRRACAVEDWVGNYAVVLWARSRHVRARKIATRGRQGTAGSRRPRRPSGGASKAAAMPPHTGSSAWRRRGLAGMVAYGTDVPHAEAVVVLGNGEDVLCPRALDGRHPVRRIVPFMNGNRHRVANQG